MTEENLKAFAMANGYQKQYEAMTQLERGQLRLAFVEQALASASGDFIRSQNSWANQLRILSGQWQQFKSNLGSGFIQVLTPILQGLNILMEKLVQLSALFAKVMNFITGGKYSFGGGSGGITDTLTDAVGLGGELGDTLGDAIGLGGDLGDTLDDATGSAGGLSDELGGVSDELSDGAGNAKAMADQMERLMGIDQLHKLNADKGSDSGSGSGSGGSGGSGGGAGAGDIGGLDTSGFDTGASELEKKAQELSDKMKAILSELLSPLKTAWSNYGEWFLKQWNYFKDSFKYACNQLASFLKAVWNNGGKEFVQHMAEIGIAVGGVALQIGGKILESIGKLFQHLNPDSNPYTKKFIEVMNKLAESVRDFVISAGQWFSKFMDLGGSAFINVIGDIAVIVGTTLAEVLNDIISLVTAFMNSWAGTALIGACAIALDLVATAIKVLAIIIEKCHVVLTGLVLAFGAWKLTTFIGSINNAESALGRLAYKLVGLYANITDNIKGFGDWVRAVGTNALTAIKNFSKAVGTTALSALRSFGNALAHPLKTLGSMCKAIGETVIALGKQVKELVLSGVHWVANTAKIIAQKAAYLAVNASIIASTVAMKASVIAQKALNLAMSACPIIAMIALITGLIIVVKKIGDKFGWWKAIAEALGKVMDWVKDKISGVWSKIKGFFGFEDAENKIPDESEKAEESLDGLGEEAENVAKTMDDAFGTSASNINTYLDSIGFNATGLAESVSEAEASFNEKFSMMSKTAQDYLDAIVSGNEENLAQFAGQEGACIEEIKAMYADLSEEEKNQLYAKYGVIQGVNEEWLNLEGLTYDQLVAKHVAYVQNVEANENLSYEQKKQLIAEHEQAVQESYNKQLTALREQLAQVERDETLSNEERKARKEELTNRIKELEGEKVKNNQDAENKIKDTSKKSADEQIQSQKKVADAQKNSLKEVDSALKTTRDNINKLSTTSTDVANKIKTAFSGMSNTLKTTVSGMISSINSSMSKLSSNSVNQVNNMKNQMVNAFNNMKNSCINAINGLDGRVSNVIGRAMNSAVSQVQSALWRIQSMINNFSATLHVKVPHFTMSGTFNAKTGQVPTIGVSYYAKGGIMTKATPFGFNGNNLAVGGENGREAILPLDRNTQWQDQIATKMATILMQQSENNDKPINVNLNVDGKTLADVVVKQNNKAKKHKGKGLFD